MISFLPRKRKHGITCTHVYMVNFDRLLCGLALNYTYNKQGCRAKEFSVYTNLNLEFVPVYAIRTQGYNTIECGILTCTAFMIDSVLCMYAYTHVHVRVLSL